MSLFASVNKTFVLCVHVYVQVCVLMGAQECAGVHAYLYVHVVARGQPWGGSHHPVPSTLFPVT